MNPVHRNIERFFVSFFRWIVAQIAAQELAAFIENLQRDRSGRCQFHVVVHDCARGRILGRGLFRRKRRALIGAGPHAERRRGRKQKSVPLRDGLVHLAQRSHIIEDPK